MRTSSRRRVGGALGAAATCLALWADVGHPSPAPLRSLSDGPRAFTLHNRFAYIPPQCYARTRRTITPYSNGAAGNPCFVCHLRSEPPNFVDDGELQATLSLPEGAADNPWSNLLDPPFARTARASDEDILSYVRQSNYLEEDGRTLALERTIDKFVASDRTIGWRGFRPDAMFSFDDRGFDRRPDGSFTGWRAFAYFPLPGSFLPTNGSIDDVLIRLPRVLQEDPQGRFDLPTYEVNLAIVAALVAPADRREHLAYAGRGAIELAAGRLQMAAGLFPRGTEFLHSVRYLDVAPDGRVTMAARMKELRYARKEVWLSYPELQARNSRETLEQARSADGAGRYAWQYDRGISNGQGWIFQGFIEDAGGTLRPQSYEESVTCVGCHGGIGATTDSIFSLPRKLGPAYPGAGWFHPTQHDLRGVAEPRTRAGDYEYTRYLAANGAGDEFHQNEEVRARFFDPRGLLREDEVARLHDDVSYLLLPSPERALDLDRAYRAIVREQSFARGREAILAPSRNVYARAPVDGATGIAEVLSGP